MLSKVDRIREYLYIDDKEEIFNSKQNEYIDKYVYETFKDIDNYGKRILMVQILYGIIKFESKEIIKDYEDNRLKCNFIGRKIKDKQYYLNAYLTKLNQNKNDMLSMVDELLK